MVRLPDVLPWEGHQDTHRFHGKVIRTLTKDLGSKHPSRERAGASQWAKGQEVCAFIHLVFCLPIGGSKKFHHPREPGGTGGRSFGLTKELQLGHHQRGAGGQATAQGLLTAH